MSRISGFREFIITILSGHEESAALVLSQVISNVPAALLLSGFTDNWRALLIGCNIGGLGTLIASMASLISYKHIAREYPGKSRRYLFKFTVWNVVMLAVLIILNLILE